MSREIDERVVQMKFENGQFEKNVQTSIHSLDELKKGLDFQDAAKGFDKIDKSSRDVNLDPITQAVQQLNGHFNLLGITAINVMNRISNAAINTGEKLFKSLTIDQITPGWTKYENKTSSVQTIMAATAKQFSDTGEQMKVVNEQLNKLNWFTDETSYNFVDMVNNIGKFTSNNIGLEQSVTAMQGIANWAAISGANANEASRAMYNLAQALATGTVKLIDWKSIENANMATTEFKQTVIDIAEAEGTLLKVSDNLWTTLDKKVEVSVSNFNEGLAKGWFTKDVLMKALDRYGAATNKLNEITEKYGMTASSLIQDIDKYTKVVNEARSQSQALGETEEQTQKRIADATKSTVEEITASWGDGAIFEDVAAALSEFDNELMQFGLKSFKAAQEAKTFSEAIGSVTDAVSTGWMKTFELLFGDYMQAKEFWTNIANTLYDIFAASGDARNDMLSEWAEQGGQKYFVDAIYATLAAILSILAPIKAAWNSVFGSVTARQLKNLTVRLRNFMLRLSASEETMQKIARVFRGLFSVLDLVKTIFTELVGGVLQGFQRIMVNLGIDVGEFAASAGDVVYYLTQWIKQTGIVQKAITLLADIIIAVIRNTKEFVHQLSNWVPAQNALSKFKDIALVALKAVGSAIYVLIDILQWLFRQFQNFHLPNSFDEVAQFFSEFSAKVLESFEKIGISTDKLGNGFGLLGTIIKNTVGTIVNVFSAATQGVAATFDLINRYLSSVDWAGVLLAAFGVGTIALLWKFTTALNTLAGAVKNVTNVGAKAGGALDAIKNYFTALQKNVQTNNILKTAIAIAALAAACGLLARLDWQGVLSGGAAILMIAGAVTVLTMAFDHWSTKHGSMNGKGMLAMTQFVLALAASMVAIAYALNNVRIDEDIGTRMAVLGGALVTLSATAAIFSVVAKPIQVGAGALVGIAASLLIMVNALKSIKPEDAPVILSMLPVVAALMLVMAALTRMMTTTKKTILVSGDMVSSAKSGSGLLSIIGLVAGLHLMIAAIKTLAKMQPDVAAKGIALMIPVILLIQALLKYVGLASKEAKSAGQMVMYIAAAINLLYFAIKNLATLNIQEIVQGGLIVTALMGLSLLLVKFSGGAGRYAAKAGLMILEIAAALTIIQLVIKTLGRLDFATAFKGTAAVSALILAMGFMLRGIAGNMQANADGVKALTKIIITVGMLSALILALTYIDPLGALAVSAGLLLVFKSFSEMLKAMKLADDIDFKKFSSIMVAIGILGAIIGGLGAITDWKGALAVSGGIALVLVSLGAMMKLANKSTGGLTAAKLKPMAAIVAELAVIVAAFVGLIAIVGPENIDAGKIAVLTVSLSGIMIAFGLMTGIMGSMKGKPDDKNVNALIKIVNAFGILIGAFSAIAGIASLLGASLSDVIFLATGMSEIMLALGAMTRLMNNVKVPENFDDLQRLTIVISVVTGIMALLAGYASTHGADLSQTLTLAESMSLLLVALGAAVRIMNGRTFKIDLGMLATLGALVAGLGGILVLFQNWVTNPGNLLPFALSMVPLLIGVAAAATILSHFKSGGLVGATEGVLIAIEIVAAIGLLIAALGSLEQMTGGSLSGWFENGAQMMADIGSGIGNFIGGIVGGLASGLTNGFEDSAVHISAGMVALQPFFDGLTNMPDNILELGSRLVEVISKIANPGFSAALGYLKSVADAMQNNSENLSTIFTTFGKALKAFGIACAGIDIAAVVNGVDAARQLSELEASLPKKGGLLQTILGEDDLSSFGSRLQTLGMALWNFSLYGKLIDSAGMKIAVNASKDLQDLETKLPAKDGALQAFFGQDGFDKFGSRLQTYGEALVAFSDSVSGNNGGNGLDVSAMEEAIIATKDLSDIESALTASGSIIGGFFFGNSDLGTFGKRLSDYGEALSGFCDAIRGKIETMDILKAVTATRMLSQLEEELNTHGGWNAFWNGDNTFGQFGKNLQGLGVALSNFAANVSKLNWPAITLAVDFIEDLTKIDKLDEAANRTLTATKKLMTDILDVIKAQEVPITTEARNMAYWLAKGFEAGMIDYENIAINAAVQVANSIISIMNSIFKIHSPSVVMDEMGHWVVKGLGEGITDEMSAEEAAEQKAQDIITAFQNGLSKMNAKLDISNLEYELWTRTKGKFASDSEKASRQLEQEVEKLKAKAKEVSMMRTAMNAVLETAGEDSDAYMTAYKNYLQSQNDMYDQQSVVDSLQKTTVQNTNATLADQMKQFAQLQAQNAEAFKFMGKSEEDLRKWAAEQVGAGFERQMKVNDLLLEYKDAFDRLEYSQEQRIAEVDRILGPETAAKVKNTLYDTNAIIEEAMQDTSYTLEEAVSKSLSGAVKKGGSSGAVSGAIGDVGTNIAGGLQESITNSISNMDFDFSNLGLDKLENALSVFNDPSQITSQISNFFTGDNGILGAFQRESQPITDAVTSWGENLVDSIFGEGKSKAWYEGARNWLGKDGVKGGLEDPTALKEVETSAEDIPEKITDTIENYTNSGNNGTVYYDLGKQAPAGMAAGETDPSALNLLRTGSQTLSNTAQKPISDDVPKYRKIGQYTSQGFAQGMLDEKGTIVKAAKEIANAANTAFTSTLKIESPSKVTTKIGQYVGEGLAIGMLNRKTMVENSADEIASSAVTALDYAKSIISNVLATDEDFTPTITPVLDLDTLTQEAKSIPNLLNRNTNLNLSATARRANQIQSNFNQVGQNGSNVPNQTNYNLIQNNYSPKALSRLEIYRQTNNQFSRLKGATQK